MMICFQEVKERKRRGEMLGGTDHSWSDPTQSHHTASHVTVPTSAESEYSTMMDYQKQEHGFSEYKTVILGSLKKKIKGKNNSKDNLENNSDVYAPDKKYGGYSDSGNNSVTGMLMLKSVVIVSCLTFTNSGSSCGR